MFHRHLVFNTENLTRTCSITLIAKEFFKSTNMLCVCVCVYIYKTESVHCTFRTSTTLQIKCRPTQHLREINQKKRAMSFIPSDLPDLGCDPSWSLCSLGVLMSLAMLLAYSWYSPHLSFRCLESLMRPLHTLILLPSMLCPPLLFSHTKNSCVCFRSQLKHHLLKEAAPDSPDQIQSHIKYSRASILIFPSWSLS